MHLQILFSISLLGCFGLSCSAPKKVRQGQEERSADSPKAAEQQANSAPADKSSAPADKVSTMPPEPTPIINPKPSVLPLESGNLQATWIHGSADCALDKNPPLQVHVYNKNMTILRQNKCVNFEAPFLYLIFGAKKALLLDSGATASATSFPVRTTIEALLTEHYGAAQRPMISLIVAHSHAHGDHRAADAQFAGQPATTVVGSTQALVASFFGIQNWPESIVDYDLGGRVIQIIPIPGHEPSHLAFYDSQTGLLFSGDSLYPGRLYIQDWSSYQLSISRLRRFADTKTISSVLGAHIEMTSTSGQDYPAGTTFQPNEHPLPLSKNSLILLDEELKKIGATPMQKNLGDFIISP